MVPIPFIMAGLVGITSIYAGWKAKGAISLPHTPEKQSQINLFQIGVLIIASISAFSLIKLLRDVFL